MRELEFLPEWYPVLRRRRGLAVTQAWATAVLMGTICLYGVAAHQRVMGQEAASAQIARDMQQTRSELKMLDEQLTMQKQLQQQELIQARVGLQIDATRLLGELDSLMSKEMFLLELSAETQETTKSADLATANNRRASASERSANPADEKNVTRRLRVKLNGVAPSDVDVANFLAGLTNKPFFDQVAMNYSKERVQEGRLMREFELTFLINLGAPPAE